ncbi:MAG: hypothetical protein JW940_02660 [Polyangiaceae bacterium]|nr:hypothetical protein [Polyangiaceae bacterium]
MSPLESARSDLGAARKLEAELEAKLANDCDETAAAALPGVRERRRALEGRVGRLEQSEAETKTEALRQRRDGLVTLLRRDGSGVADSFAALVEAETTARIALGEIAATRASLEELLDERYQELRRVTRDLGEDPSGLTLASDTILTSAGIEVVRRLEAHFGRTSECELACVGLDSEVRRLRALEAHRHEHRLSRPSPAATTANEGPAAA